MTDACWPLMCGSVPPSVNSKDPVVAVGHATRRQLGCAVRIVERHVVAGFKIVESPLVDIHQEDAPRVGAAQIGNVRIAHHVIDQRNGAAGHWSGLRCGAVVRQEPRGQLGAAAPPPVRCIHIVVSNNFHAVDEDRRLAGCVVGTHRKAEPLPLRPTVAMPTSPVPFT